MVGKKTGAVYDASLMFKVSEAERNAFRILAAKEGKKNKEFLFSLLDKQYPNWREEVVTQKIDSQQH